MLGKLLVFNEPPEGGLTPNGMIVEAKRYIPNAPEDFVGDVVEDSLKPRSCPPETCQDIAEFALRDDVTHLIHVSFHSIHASVGSLNLSKDLGDGGLVQRLDLEEGNLVCQTAKAKDDGVFVELLSSVLGKGVSIDGKAIELIEPFIDFFFHCVYVLWGIGEREIELCRCFQDNLGVQLKCQGVVLLNIHL